MQNYTVDNKNRNKNTFPEYYRKLQDRLNLTERYNNNNVKTSSLGLIKSLFVFLAAKPSKLVGDNNIELGSTLHNLFPLPR